MEKNYGGRCANLSTDRGQQYLGYHQHQPRLLHIAGHEQKHGQKIGKLYYEKSHADTGIVEIEDKKFQYAFRNSPLAEIAVFNEGETNPVVACGLAAKDGQTMVKLTRDGNFADRDMQYILFALSWYLFLPVAQEHTLAYAV
jgi:hypothetical protein